MASMCRICDDFKSGKIDSQNAFNRIRDALVDQSDSEKIGHLMELSATILDKDVPLAETNEQADRDWEENYNQEE